MERNYLCDNYDIKNRKQDKSKISQVCHLILGCFRIFAFEDCIKYFGCFFFRDYDVLASDDSKKEISSCNCNHISSSNMSQGDIVTQ